VEAKSANHFKEVSYKLENKVVELTQTVTTLKGEKKELNGKITHLESQIQHMTETQAKMEKKAKKFEEKLRESSIPQSDYLALQKEVESYKSKHELALEKVTKLNEELTTVKKQLETEKESSQNLHNSVENMKKQGESRAADNKEVTDLKAQIVALKTQLAKAMHTSSRQGSLPPSKNSSNRALSPGNNRHHPIRIDSNEIDDTKTRVTRRNSVLTNRKARRNSSAEVTGNVPKSSIDQIRLAEELGGGKNPRPTSVGQYNTVAGGKSGHLDQISDNPEEEVNNI
jgi:myosin-5